MIRIDNKANWIIAEKYFKKYKAKIERLYPELEGRFLGICEANAYPNKNETQKVDIDSPLQIIAQKEEDRCTLNCDMLVFVKDYLGKPCGIHERFCEKELFALISHEIGHLALHYRNETFENCYRRDEKEEFVADKTALKLGFGRNLLDAIVKLKEDTYREDTNNSLGPFGSLPGLGPEIKIEKMNRRIYRLKNTIKFHYLIL